MKKLPKSVQFTNGRRAPAENSQSSRNWRWLSMGVALTSAALYVNHKKKRAEWENPPQGKFIHVNGVRLHYVERGSGTPLVLLHGSTAMAQDFCLSGLVELAAQNYRVIVFDRPGYGYSERPRNRLWGPQAQAELIHEALEQIGVSQAIVLGHSWGTLVAMALALDYPESVRSLVLASGYYYPTLRPEVPIAAQRLVPVIGDVMRYTTTPIMMRMMWPFLAKRIFHPNAVPPHFKNFPVWMAARPLQIRASAEEFTYAIPSVMSLRKRYKDLRVPLMILAGSEDRMTYVSKHSQRLHDELPESELRLIAGAGHMVHHVAPDQVMEAVDAAALKSEMPVMRKENAEQALFRA
ncbi:alpha/beta hydrolase [Oxalobacteraceae bacterium R-40]|uniref:Alpha/beta hydrolase n=1 Tax=Keguizhuia sedimenti TaxID=3064264 RepID=A0ABU1BSP4_9BURK|nr:alpha/beta hydrolase [Oxalobacteraceae bacterium R-40]